MIEDEDVAIEYIKHIRRVVLVVVALWYGNGFEITNGIERRVAEQPAGCAFSSGYLKMPQKLVDGRPDVVRCRERAHFLRPVREVHRALVAVYANAREGAKGDVREAVLVAVIV